MATIRDVAKKAGVGVGTVSRALNDSGYAARATREKIWAAADEIGYEYDSAVRFPGRAGIIGVIVPFLEHPFFSRMTECLESELFRRGYRCLLYNTCNLIARQTDFMEMLDNGLVSGLIALADPPPDFSGRRGRAIVSMDRNWGNDVPLIRSDHSQGGRMAAEAFLESGCRKVIQFYGGDLSITANTRHAILEKILKENGCAVTSVHTPWNYMGYTYDKNVIRDYWNVIREMDGCMTNDVAALSCLSVAQEKGISVPEQLRIIGYDGTKLTSLCYPALSVVEQDCPRLAEVCVDRLLELLEGTGTPEMLTTVPVLWKKRGTT